MGHRSAHVFALGETHVRDAVGFHPLLFLLLLLCVLSPAASLVASSSIMTTAAAAAAAAVLSVVLGTAEKRGPKVVHASTEQIYIMDTVEVDRLGEKAQTEWEQTI